MGLLSYKINNSYAYFTNSVTGNSVIEMTYTKPSLDKSGANAPVLTDNMIPVYYDEASSTWKKADSTNTNKDYKWYDYDNKMWANAVTVTGTNRSTYLNAKAGTTIPMSDINTMWVWIPRYTYTYLNTHTPQEINIKFEKGTNSSGTISCSDTATGESSTSEECTDTTNGGLKAGTSTYTHPAFWWDKDDDNVRESGEELTGIWVGKFEISSGYIIKPNVTSLKGPNISTFFINMYNMRNSGNDYGFSKVDETHMMKNMEWGAVAYLSHSKYGRCTDGTCTEVTTNNCSSYITGIGADTVSASSSSTTCTTNANKYNGKKGVLASTTGNIYGIYDMSGGISEYIMGDLVSSTGIMMSGYYSVNSTHSGFTGYLYKGGQTTLTYDFPDKRYYDKYSYGTNYTEYARGKLGDATKEMTANNNSYTSWYSDSASFPFMYFTWFTRGGTCGNDSSAGLFNFVGDEGGRSINYFSSRAVISNLN